MIFSWGWQTLHWLKVKVQRAALMYSYGGEREREGEGERERQRDREREREYTFEEKKDKYVILK